MRSECEAEFSKPCAGVVTKRRGCLAAPMYEVQHARRPQAAAGRLLMYDLRFSMYDLE